MVRNQKLKLSGFGGTCRLDKTPVTEPSTPAECAVNALAHLASWYQHWEAEQANGGWPPGENDVEQGQALDWYATYVGGLSLASSSPPPVDCTSDHANECFSRCPPCFDGSSSLHDVQEVPCSDFCYGECSPLAPCVNDGLQPVPPATGPPAGLKSDGYGLIVAEWLGGPIEGPALPLPNPRAPPHHLREASQAARL